jgi:hypothetical protein
MRGGKQIDITGQRYNHLTAIEFVERSRNRSF